MKIPDFKASNQWLKKLRTRHSIVFCKMIREAADCPMTEIKAWLKTSTFIIVDYESQNIFNCDEVGLFF